MDVPTGKTAEAPKPNTIALAKEILPKVKCELLRDGVDRVMFLTFEDPQRRMR